MSAEFKPPEGPRWVKGVRSGDTQTDGRGQTWFCESVEAGGRVVNWRLCGTDRLARTEAMPSHPDYPSDAEALAWEKARKAESKANYGMFYP